MQQVVPKIPLQKIKPRFATGLFLEEIWAATLEIPPTYN